MPGRYFEEIEVGEHFNTCRRTVTETDIVNFVSLTAMYDPLFMDMEFVREKTVYEGRIVPGPLTLSMAIGLVTNLQLFSETVMGMLGLQVRFPRPVRPGDTIGVDVEIISKKETSKADRGVIDLKYEVKNQRAEVVAEIIHTMLLKRQPST